MTRLARVACLLLACASPAPRVPLSNTRALATDAVVLVHGTVMDYAQRAVPNARVEVTARGTTTSVQTDASGRFTARVPPHAYLSASQGDMMGGVELGDAAEQVVVIKMMEMPM